MSTRFLSKQEENRIVEAIRKAEEKTSGEIRVHISKNADENSMQTTQALFFEFKMHETKHRNAVLIHLSLTSKSFSILGDEGIDKVSIEDFWNTTKDYMLFYFLEDKIAEGIIAGIQEVGKILKEHFPIDKNDENPNELENEITYS